VLHLIDRTGVTTVTSTPPELAGLVRPLGIINARNSGVSALAAGRVDRRQSRPARHRDVSGL
jgi:hypothetical protein